MNNVEQIDRRNLLKLLSVLPFTGFVPKAVKETGKSPVLRYLHSLRRADGGYAWPDDPGSTLPTTFAALACFRLLREEPPARSEIARFLRGSYPQVLIHRKDDRPLHRFDYEQVQSLLWLGEPVDSFRARASQWVKPYLYPIHFELYGDPVFEQEVSAILCRQLLGISPTYEWSSYVLSRRRADGSFNNTPSQDGSGGHISNTLWGILALQALGHEIDLQAETAEWVRSCQIKNDLITYSPDTTLAANDHVAYVWAAVKTLKLLGSSVRNPEGARSYLCSLWNEDGGFGDRPGRASNPLATMQALEALSLCGFSEASTPRRPAKRQSPVPYNLKAYTIQIEAPGSGSPQIAVDMAKALKVNLWGAKNAEPGWIEAAQALAAKDGVPVTFFVSNEEYGTYLRFPGLGAYSHLADVTAPAGSHFGAPLSLESIQPISWPEFLSQRIGPLHAAGGSNVWQYNQNEELSRILLEQAVQNGCFSAISTFHFAQNFLETQPFLNRYRDVIPFVSLQDAHLQTWWWMEHLVGFRTVFLAEAPTWEGWMAALQKNRVVGLRHDMQSGLRTQITGGSNAVREEVLKQQERWRWWDENTAQIVRPQASLTVVSPHDRFEGARPDSGLNLVLRCWWDLDGNWTPTQQMVKLISFEVDGKRVEPQMVRVPPPPGGIGGDIYHVWPMESDQHGNHKAIATVQTIETGVVTKVSKTFSI